MTKKDLRRRGSLLEQALLRATWEELEAVGYAHVTMDGVAARAKTSKPVIYRRWPTRAKLVLAAMSQEAPLLATELPDTGSLRGDALALLSRASRRLRELGPELVHGLLTEAFAEPDFISDVQAQNAGIQAMRSLVARAVKRGELSTSKFSNRIMALPTDLLRHEVLLTHTHVPRRVILEIVDDIFLPLIFGAKRPRKSRVLRSPSA